MAVRAALFWKTDRRSRSACMMPYMDLPFAEEHLEAAKKIYPVAWLHRKHFPVYVTGIQAGLLKDRGLRAEIIERRRKRPVRARLTRHGVPFAYPSFVPETPDEDAHWALSLEGQTITSGCLEGLLLILCDNGRYLPQALRAT